MNQLVAILSDQNEPDTVLIAIGFGIVFTSMITGFYVWGLISRKRFFEKAIETYGTVVGMLGATYRVVTYQDPDSGYQEEADVPAGGKLLLVEFETEDHIYKVKTKKVYSKFRVGDTISVHYNPENPSKCSINQHYDINPITAKIIVSVGACILLYLIFVFITY